MGTAAFGCPLGEARQPSYFPVLWVLPNFHSCAFISTRRPRKRTPSASSRSRCSIAESPVSLIAPPAPSTRCQGSPNPRRRVAATCRAAPGNPAARATPPYVDTLPRGIARTACSIRRRIAPGSFCLVFPARGRRLFRLTVSFLVVAQRPLTFGKRAGILNFSRDGVTPLCGRLPALHTPSYALQTPSAAW